LYVFADKTSIDRIHGAVTRKFYYFDSINKMLKVFDNETFKSDILQNVKKNISGNEISAAASIHKLGRLINSFDYRLNMIVGVALNGLILWDYQCVNRLEKWKLEYKSHFTTWLEMLGQVDAFVSLGNFAANNPDYVYPSIADGDNFLSSIELGHPLIDEQVRVCNNFDMQRKGTAVIVTGANMSGKSTFLRTLAVNYILAMTGSPVCAKRFIFRPVKLFTSMRTEDSLSSNESYFYAELKRLKQLRLLIDNNEPVFFILDEILKGTNSADKSLGSKMFLTKLIEMGGTGLIATHDISLGELEIIFPDKIINKCFEIEIDEGKISFDYILRQGITSKMNAGLLMKQMGIVE
jgi:DNA mismatch repair ATPase MutS